MGIRRVFREEGAIIAIMTIFAMLPYVITKSLMPGCGWDCTWYYWTLKYANYSTFHQITEPVYYWMFGWMVNFMDAMNVILVSQIVLPIILFIGTYLLCRRLGLSPLYSSLVVIMVAFTTGTQRLWWDTLRNFTAYALIPWFMYFFLGSKRDTYVSYGIMVLMILSHRMSILLIPMILAHFMSKPNRIDLRKIIVIGAAVLVIMPVFFYLVQDSWKYFNYPIKTIYKVSEIPLEMIGQNMKILWQFSGPTITMASVGILAFWKRINYSRNWKFVLIFFTMTAIAGIFLTRLTANRIANFAVFPSALLVGFFLQNLSGMVNWKRLAGWGGFMGIFSLMIFATMWNSMTVHSHTHPNELEFLESLDLPEGSLVVAPSRLYPDDYSLYRDDIELRRVSYRFYNRTEGRMVYNQTSPEALLYSGENRFNRTLYIIDGDHWWWNRENPLVLYEMGIDGKRTRISQVDYGERRLSSLRKYGESG